MRVQTLSEQLFFVTCMIECRVQDDGWTGTGFVYDVKTSDGVAYFLVTNKHVLSHVSGSPVDVTVRFPMSQLDSDGNARLGNATETRIEGISEGMWIGHPNPAVDVAVMPLSAVFEDMIANERAPLFRSVDATLSVERVAPEGLDALEDVVFVGYPNGIYDRANFLPVMRRGTTATPPEVDYNGLPAFLIDAAVFGGSSGSPVFILSKGVTTTREGGVSIGAPTLMFVGVVAAVHLVRQLGEIAEMPAKFMAVSDVPMGLGIVYKASAVEDVVEMWLERAGIGRASAPSPMGSLADARLRATALE